MLDEFLIPSAAGSGGLLFFDRSPPDRSKPVETFWVRVTGRSKCQGLNGYAGLQALNQTYAGTFGWRWTWHPRPALAAVVDAQAIEPAVLHFFDVTHESGGGGELIRP